jgi:hypothetical protein
MNILPHPPETQPRIDLIADNDPARGVHFIAETLGSTILVALYPDGGPVVGCYVDSNDTAAAEEWAVRMNAVGRNIYYHGNCPTPGLNKKVNKADIVSIRSVYADVDAKDGRTMDQALDAVRSLPLTPTFIVMTGGGYQPVWVLSDPLPPTDENIRRVEMLGKRIAGMLGGDDVQNIDRILRLPFTVNYPSAGKRAAGRDECLSGIVAEGATS